MLCVLPAHTSTSHPELHRHTLGKKIIIDIEKVYKSPFSPLKRKKCLKISVSSTWNPHVWFALQLSWTQKLSTSLTPSGIMEVLLFMDMNQLQILKWKKKKKNKEKAKPQIIKAFKRSFHYNKPQLLIFSLSLAAVFQLHIAFHPGLLPSSESQCKHPNSAGSEIRSWAEGRKGLWHCFLLVWSQGPCWGREQVVPSA